MQRIARFLWHMAVLQNLPRASHWLRFVPCHAPQKTHTSLHSTEVFRMISLAGRDILHGWGKFVFTGVGLGLLIGVTLTMAGVYRGMIDDAQVLIDNSGADLWVVQKDTLGPYAESSSLYEDIYRGIVIMPGVAQAVNVTYFTMQVRHGERDVRSMAVGIVPGEAGQPGWPPYLVAGRQITRSHYEAVADQDSPKPLHGGGADPAHGLLQWRPDGVHSPQGCAGGAVPQGQ
jgi:hypothetical protein